MASPTTTARRRAASSRSSRRRGRVSVCGIGVCGNLLARWIVGQRTGPCTAQPLPFPSWPLSRTTESTRLSEILEGLNETAKSKVSGLQEYFILAGKSLRFVVARPFYGQDVVQQM